MYDRRPHSTASKPCTKCVHAPLYEAGSLTALPAAMYHICRKPFLLHLTNSDALCTVHHNFCHEQHEQAAILQRRRAGQSKAHNAPKICGQLSLVRGAVARRAAGGSRQVRKVSKVRWQPHGTGESSTKWHRKISSPIVDAQSGCPFSTNGVSILLVD